MTITYRISSHPTMKYAPRSSYVGDEPLVNIRIPKKLGMHTIQLDRSREARKSSEADAIARTLTEAVNIIEK